MSDRHGIRRSISSQVRLRPVNFSGCLSFSARYVSAVGARSANSPSSRSCASGSVTTIGTGFVVWAVCGLTPSAASSSSALPWSAVTRQTPPAAVTASTTWPRHASAVSTACRGGDRARVADHVGVREVDDAERVALPISSQKRVGRLACGHLGLEVVARHVARARHEHPRLPRPLLLSAAVEEVRDVGVLLGLGDVQLPQAARDRTSAIVSSTSISSKRRGSRGRRCSASSSSGRSRASSRSRESWRPRSGRKLKKIAVSSGVRRGVRRVDDRLDEFVGDAGVVARLHGARAGLSQACPDASTIASNALSRSFPALVAVHRVVAADDGRDPLERQLGEVVDGAGAGTRPARR